MSTRQNLSTLVFSCMATVSCVAATAAEPAVEQLKLQSQQQAQRAKGFGQDLQRLFDRRDRRVAEDSRQETKLQSAISDALAADTRAVLQHVECRSLSCKATLQLAHAEDRPQVLFALLASHECGVAVPENSGTTLVAYLDCATNVR